MICPARYYDELMVKGEIVDDPKQRLALKKIQQLHRQLQVYGEQKKAFCFKKLLGIKKSCTDTPKGIYFFGSNGCGKSMLVQILYKTLPIKQKQYYHFHTFLLKIKAQLAHYRAKKILNPLHQVAKDLRKKAWIFFFDECVLHDIGDALLFGRVVQDLLTSGGVIICTSNFSPQNLTPQGAGKDIFKPYATFLFKHMHAHNMNSLLDYRGKQAKDCWRYYYYPLNAQTEKKMTRVIDSIASGRKFTPHTLKVGGHALSFFATNNGIACSDYSTIILKPYGTEDFMKIAEYYHTVIIKNLGAIQSDDTSTVKRFILLVDAMYEAKGRLIISAAVAPENLYKNGIVSFEFKRALSRLKEMQSSRYGKDLPFRAGQET